MVVSIRYFSKRMKKVIEARILKRWGSTTIKKAIWEKEFASGEWEYLDQTNDDIIYDYLEKYTNNGSILDLGCGSGNTGNEIDDSRYESYTGVDISEDAIHRALIRSRINGRQSKNEYACEDISLFMPRRKYDVILFRESIFYFPKGEIKGVLNRYSCYLKDKGVFMVRMCDRKKYKAIVSLIQKDFRVLEVSPGDDKNIILVFR